MPNLSAFVPKGMSLRGTYDTSGTSAVSVFGGGPSSSVSSIAVQSDDKIIVGGLFTRWNGTTVGRIARVNTDGSLDTAFTTATGTGPNSGAANVVIQPDGKIIVYGSAFTSWNSTSVGRIVRLNTDGSLDTSFTTANGTGASSNIMKVAFQSDGKIIVVGFFTTWNGTAAPYIVRLNSDGSLDTSFTTANGTGPNGSIRAVAVQSDNKIVISGNLTSWNGTTVGGFARLNSDGSLDTSFVTANGTGTTAAISNIAIQSDGKIVAGSALFSSWNGTTVGNIVRLNSDGSLDTAFTTANGTGAFSQIDSLAIQADGKIILGGGMSSWNGTTVANIARLNTDGSLDTAFVTATGTGTNSNIDAIAFQSDGKILLGGQFVLWNTLTFRYFVRISSSGSVVGAYEIPVDVVFAVLAGGGGGGSKGSTSNSASGGGAGSVVWGLVPAQDTCVIGAGGGDSATGGTSRYSTLIAFGGGAGNQNGVGENGTNGSSGGGGGATTSAFAGGNGSTLFQTVGGSGGAGAYSTSASVTATSGIRGGGGGGARTNSGTTVTVATGGSGGSGFAGGGGGAGIAATNSSAIGGAGGNSFGYTGGSPATSNNSRYANGGGGAGIAGNGNNATSDVDAGDGGIGGGGGGGSANSDTHGQGGVGALLLYW